LEFTNNQNQLKMEQDKAYRILENPLSEHFKTKYGIELDKTDVDVIGNFTTPFTNSDKWHLDRMYILMAKLFDPNLEDMIRFKSILDAL